jgi:hypothetical protein
LFCRYDNVLGSAQRVHFQRFDEALEGIRDCALVGVR